MELLEIIDIAVLDEDKTYLRIAASSSRETCVAKFPGLHNSVTVVALIRLEDGE